ncbi:MAG TPA: transcription-repair coupling factor, partial [Blastocatellia bacterium]|nr:transcription-repair coupling factor [Blastocatellia bacterium]
ESIREFDPDSQRSVGRATETIIVPMRELSVRREEFMKWAEAAESFFEDDRFRRDLRARLAHAERGETFPGWEYLLPLTRPLTSSAFDYFKDAVMIIDEPVEIEKRAADLYRYLEERYSLADDAGELALAPDKLFLSAEELRAKFEAATRIDFRLLGRDAAATDEQFSLAGNIAASETESVSSFTNLGERRPNPLFLFPVVASIPDISMISQSPRRYSGRVSDLAQDLGSESRITLFVMPSLGLAERVNDVLRDYLSPAELAPSLSQKRPESQLSASRIVTVGKLSNGFALPAAHLSVLTESDVFGDIERAGSQRVVPKRARKKRTAAAFLSDLGDLKVGDYVVHVDHGIGQFRGLDQIITAGGPTGNQAAGLERARGDTREFMLLTYAEGARLFVPVERLDLVQRYSASEGYHPPLDKLGGLGWQKAKARAKRAMRDMAEELLKLYAERKLVQGHAYGTDTPWQQEFEDAFEYQLTPDQESAIEDVKDGMQSTQPMDRLIVGDVGYGKTEVAMRAAFKAVMEAKQVAVLAPTTVLVLQHFKSFQQRFSAFPARIEMLSRFRTAKEIRDSVKAIEEGKVDVVVGTHRLLSKDIKFKDLGLLIVDEEQRFGVAHKERIKQMRKKVDVISMSATPIPRTLNMSLAGLRDMSVIETPPRDRLAIQTHVVQFSEPVVRSAIELELQRSGQVFFVHNRVETIYTIAELIGRLVPQARIGVGHGQMAEKDLEEVIIKFIRHDLDVLVCTTIIENGIDIPLANTIIINRADKYGLSQLYQLRGRVGRSNRRAYSYLLIPAEDTLTDIARRRLAAIREFSDLGAGFRIAALDLELRGAGNLLGSQQSGQIDAMGFDLYTRMLERTVRELKGESIEDEVSSAINLGVDIRIPEDYIYDMSQRLRTYKRISSAETEEELADVHAEIADRYGPIPETIESLFEYSRLRREASSIGIISIDREGDRLAVKFTENARIDPDKLIAMVSEGSASFAPSGVLKIRLNSQDDNAVFSDVRDLIMRLR